MVDPGTDRLDISDAILFILSLRLSIGGLSGYATLDADHLHTINSLIINIGRYVEDTSQKRPLNFLMLASPGAGKSHFIKCIAEKLRSQKVGAITFNMAGLQRNEDLIPPLDAARNLKVEDKIPLLFLDEFDSRPGDISLLLPLLWDGEMNLGQRDLKLGKVIIVLAGSDPSLPGTMESARNMRLDAEIPQGQNPKVIDLLSRINGGVVAIPPFYDLVRKIDRRADKACVAIQLLRHRFGWALTTVPLALLRFIVSTEFRYGVRSIAHLIDLIPHKSHLRHLRLDDINLPFGSTRALKESSLAYHLLHEEQVHGVVESWKRLASEEVAVPISSELVDRYAGLGISAKDDDYAKFLFERLSEQLQAELTQSARRSRR